VLQYLLRCGRVESLIEIILKIMNSIKRKTVFFRKLDLTLDITIYCIFYICFLITIYPVLSDLIAHSGKTQPQYTVFFWKMGWVCKQYFYIPAVVPIVIVAWCELYTNIFYYWSVRLMVKCIGAIFFLGTMVTLSPFTFIRMGAPI